MQVSTCVGVKQGGADKPKYQSIFALTVKATRIACAPLGYDEPLER